MYNKGISFQLETNTRIRVMVVESREGLTAGEN